MNIKNAKIQDWQLIVKLLNSRCTCVGVEDSLTHSLQKVSRSSIIHHVWNAKHCCLSIKLHCKFDVSELFDLLVHVAAPVPASPCQPPPPPLSAWWSALFDCYCLYYWWLDCKSNANELFEASSAPTVAVGHPSPPRQYWPTGVEFATFQDLYNFVWNSVGN